MVSFMTLIGGLSHQFSPLGQSTAISDQFNRNISFSQLASEEPTRSAQIEGMIQSQDVSSDSSVGRYVGRFEGSMQAFIPLIGYGITERWGVFVTAPILKIRTQFSTAFEASPEFESLSKSWAQTEQSGLASNIYGALQAGFEQKITAAGYRYEPNSERSMLGDLQVVSPLIFSHASDALQWGMLNTLSLPTGPTLRLDDLYGIGIGSGRFAAGSSLAASYLAFKRLKFSGSIGGGLILPAKLARRIPQNEADFLPVDSDSNVSVGFTPSFKLGLESRLQISRSWSARVGYQYQLEARDSFSGNAFTQDRYDLLSKRSGQELHTVSAGIDFSLIQAFLDGDFFFPTQLGLAASLPLAGRNTLADLTCLVQAALFF